MLVLSRRTSEEILVPSLGITLKVISIKGGTVRLGITAPDNVQILRGELLDSDHSDERFETDDSKQAGSFNQQSNAGNIPPLKTNPANQPPLLAHLRRSQTGMASCAISDAAVNETRTPYQVCT